MSCAGSYDPSLWGPLLQTARRLRDDVHLTFRATVLPLQPKERRAWVALLDDAHFSSWVLPELDHLPFQLELRRSDDCTVHALLPSAAVPPEIEAGLLRVLTMRAWLDGELRSLPRIEIRHAHIAAPRRALPAEPLGPRHVNGGMTSSVCGGAIVCYRAEEAPKVWTHEYLHHRCVDAGLRHVLHGPGAMLSEAFVETWATIWNALHALLESRRDAGVQALVRVMESERQHALQQAARVLHHQGVRRWEDLDLTQWRESTNLWSYYVVRAAWLWEPDAFLKTSPTPRDASRTLLHLATRIMESVAWKEAMNVRLLQQNVTAQPGASASWSLRMTATDSPLLSKIDSASRVLAKRTASSKQ